MKLYSIMDSKVILIDIIVEMLQNIDFIAGRNYLY